MLIEMQNPVLGLPRPKEMSLERGQLRALPVRRGREMAIAGREADLLNPAAGSVGSWGHQGKVSGRAYYEPGCGSCTLAGEGAWGNFTGDFAIVTFSDAQHARK